MDVVSAIDQALVNWIFFAAVVIVRLMFSHEGFRSFRLSFGLDGFILYAEGTAAAVGFWLVRALFMILTGHGSVVLQGAGHSFWIMLGWTALAYLPVALFEESLFRGYLQDHLAAKRGAGFAVVAQALIFGPLHALIWPAFPGMLVKVVMVTVLGLAFGTSTRDGRPLMWAVGFHQWWNITERVIELPLSPVRLVTAGGPVAAKYAGLVGLGAAVVILGCIRLRFPGRALPVSRLADVKDAPVGVPFAVSGNSISEMLPGNVEKGAPSIDPGLPGY